MSNYRNYKYCICRAWADDFDEPVLEDLYLKCNTVEGEQGIVKRLSNIPLKPGYEYIASFVSSGPCPSDKISQFLFGYKHFRRAPTRVGFDKGEQISKYDTDTIADDK